jgi:hypothetical protein
MGYRDESNVWHESVEWDASEEVTDSTGITTIDDNANPNPYEIVTGLDKRGDIKLAATWVWAVGKTFHSGYLNIPVNAYFSYGKDGWFTGLSVGFNIAKKD